MQTSPLCLLGFISPVEIMLASAVPMLIAITLFYLGFRGARKRLAGKANPTFGDTAKIAAPFWIVGLLVAFFPIALLIRGMLSAIFG